MAIIACLLGIILIASVALSAQFTHKNETTPVTSDKPSTGTDDKAVKPSSKAEEPYQGVVTDIAGTFSIKVPNGWRASVSENPSFLAIMFARPNQLGSLAYNTKNTPVIDRDGIPAWNGLTEHFFVIAPTTSQAFNPEAHLEVSAQPFAFSDGTTGQNYYVVKHEDEARKWGGLQKDAEWQGRTYIYEKDGKRIEAHLALYPSTNISIPFYEDVIRTLHF